MYKYILLISATIAIGLSSYFSLLPLNGVSQKDISDIYQTLITPASYTFSIWSLIYLSWVILGIISVFRKTKIWIEKIIYLAIAQIVSSFWLIPWHYDMIAMSLVIMLGLLFILLYLCIYREKDTLFQGICDFFLWWIIVACIANTHIFLMAYDLYSQWVMLSVSSIVFWVGISHFFASYKKTILPSLVLTWALLWILIFQTNNYIIITCISGMIFCLSSIVLHFIHTES